MMNIVKKLSPSLLLPILLSLPLAFSTTSAQAQQDETANNMRAYADVVRAQGDYLRALGEARLQFAKAELVMAQTAGEWQRAREMKLFVDRSQMLLQRVARDEAGLRRKAQAIEDKTQTAMGIMTGRITPASLLALNYLQVNAIEPSVTLEIMSEPVIAFADDEIISNGTLKPAPFAGSNVGQLLDYLRRYNQTVRPWGPAHLAVANGLQAMTDSVNRKLKTIRDNLELLKTSVNPFLLPEDGVKPADINI